MGHWFRKKYACAMLPRTGLANQLFPWARAVVWSKLRAVELLPTIWFTLRIGPLLRGEKDLKFYSNIFKPAGFSGVLRRNLISSFFKRCYESESLAFKGEDGRVFLFKELRDHFVPLRGYRDLIYDALSKAIREDVKPGRVSETSFVGVHIRLGDFRRNGQVLPLSWYSNMMNMVRCQLEAPTKFLIFTDGREEELGEISYARDVQVFRSNNAMTDLLALSQAKFLILSGLSSYSAWAAFLSDAPTLSKADQPITDWGLAVDHRKHFVADQELPPEGFASVLKQALS